MVFIMRKIVLASLSPRRKQLLEWAELDFDILARETKEEYPGGIKKEEIPIYIARQKALEVQSLPLYQRYEARLPILAADTIVILDGMVLGKPETREDAMNMLKSLSGKKHEVITGVVILENEKEIAFSDTTEVEFHAIGDEDIRYYVDKYNPLDKAGAYAIQEWIGVIGIKGVKGDFYNVMGLPVSRVLRVLRDHF
jgi:septum formation protein